MLKRFNYTGICVPEKHYMADISSKVETIMNMVEQGDYFTINRPRQYGKSTTLFMLERKLITRGYPIVSLDFQGIGDAVFGSEEKFVRAFVELIADKVDT